MSYLSRMSRTSTIPSGSQVSDPNESTKKRVRALARQVQSELERFTEDSTSIQGDNPKRPRVPVFFTRAFNELQSQLIAINHHDKLLHMTQHMARCSLLSEFGPAQDGNDFPECLQNGLLQLEDQPLAQEMHLFIMDVVVYIWNVHFFTGTLLSLPHSYHITLSVYKKIAERSDLRIKMLVDLIPGLIKNNLQDILGTDIVGEDYLELSDSQYKTFVDSFIV